MKQVIILSILSLTLLSMENEKKYTMLCLGDSYTIGEAVSENETFAAQTIDLLNNYNITFNKPTIVAQTGWTTDELTDAIRVWEEHNSASFKKNSDEVFVTLLIGVNNEFRGRDAEEYRKEFKGLLHTALQYAGAKAENVFVISIPDWGATPFSAEDPKQRTPAQIGNEIDQFNAISKQEALKANAHFIDITPISRQTKKHPEFIASDGLHPSGKMYTEWAKLLAPEMKKVITGN